MKTTEKGIRKFSKEEKLKILEEAQSQGVQVTLSKYGLSPGTLYYWRRKLTVYGQEGLSHQSFKDREEIARKLEKENEALRKLLKQKVQDLRLQDELLKKMYPELNKKR